MQKASTERSIGWFARLSGSARWSSGSVKSQGGRALRCGSVGRPGACLEASYLGQAPRDRLHASSLLALCEVPSVVVMSSGVTWRGVEIHPSVATRASCATPLASRGVLGETSLCRPRWAAAEAGEAGAAATAPRAGNAPAVPAPWCAVRSLRAP